MKSILDECYGFELDKLNYNNEGELSVFVTELVVSDYESDLGVGNSTIKNVSSVETTEVSKSYKIEFNEVVFYQVVDESITNWDDYEIRDGKDIIQILRKSRYLNFIDENFPIYNIAQKKGIHYRIIAITEIIDVISYDEPIIKTINKNGI